MKPWLVAQWCLAPTADPAFVWRMEDVLEVYRRPDDPVRPVVCRDETSRQLLGEARPPLLAAPRRPARRDPEYVRGGVANLFLATEPRRGWRAVTVRQQRTRLDFAECIKALVDGHDPAAETIVLVRDQLNTHAPAALDAAFPPAAAHRLSAKLEIHHPPQHGSWLTMAALEVRVRHRQCLRQRLADRATMEGEVGAWVRRRNEATTRINWQFTTAAARTKLRRRYPASDD